MLVSDFCKCGVKSQLQPLDFILTMNSLHFLVIDGSVNALFLSRD